MVELDKNLFLIGINEISQLIIYDRSSQTVQGVKNPTGDSTYYAMKVSDHYVWVRTRSYVSLYDVQAKKLHKMFNIPLQYEPQNSFYLDVHSAGEDNIVIHTLEYVSKTHSAVKAIKFARAELEKLVDAYNAK
jgi:hypothetical protein